MPQASFTSGSAPSGSGPVPTRLPPEDEGLADFDSLLVSHQERIYFFIRSMVFNPEEARDVLQDVNAIIIRKRDRFESGTDFKSWAFAIARFECLNFLRRYKQRSSLSDQEDLVLYLSEGAETHVDRMSSWLAALTACRRRLTPENNSLVSLRYATRTPLEEIALRRGTTEGALKQKLFRIRTQLRKCVLKRLAETEESTE